MGIAGARESAVESRIECKKVERVTLIGEATFSSPDLQGHCSGCRAGAMVEVERKIGQTGTRILIPGLASARNWRSLSVSSVSALPSSAQATITAQCMAPPATPSSGAVRKRRT